MAGTILLAVITLRMSAKNPGEMSALDRGILRLVSPAQSAMSFVARGIGGVAGRYAARLRGPGGGINGLMGQCRSSPFAIRRRIATAPR